ncbi:MAG: SEL1-like repeat protein [Azospirillaceae bacterium]|nr:SEL1-like repeat protein [Azospirillaceae bacterium]
MTRPWHYGGPFFAAGPLMPLPPSLRLATLGLAVLVLLGTPALAADAGPPAPPANADDSLRALDARARAGDTQAQLDLAEAYGDVPFDRAADMARAGAWYKAAAADGDAGIRRRACSALAGLEAGGMGWPENVTAALPWYRCAADLGDVQAQFNLGLLYDEGVDVPADAAQAAAWYRRAAEGGLALAQERLSALHGRGAGGPSPDMAGIALAVQTQDPATAKPPPQPAPGQPRTPPPAVDADGVRLIQQHLRNLGYLKGPVDGRPGARTANAILAYQAAHPTPWDGTVPDGWPSRDLAARLAREH